MARVPWRRDSTRQKCRLGGATSRLPWPPGLRVAAQPTRSKPRSRPGPHWEAAAVQPWGLAASVPIPDLSGEHAARSLAHGQAALAQGRHATQPAADDGRSGHQDHGGGGIPQEVQARPHRRDALARSRPHECGHPPLQKPAHTARMPKRELRRRSSARPQSPMLPAWTTQERVYGQDRVLTGTPRDAHSQHGRIGGICQEPVRERPPLRRLHGTRRRTQCTTC